MILVYWCYAASTCQLFPILNSLEKYYIFLDPHCIFPLNFLNYIHPYYIWYFLSRVSLNKWLHFISRSLPYVVSLYHLIILTNSSNLLIPFLRQILYEKQDHSLVSNFKLDEIYHIEDNIFFIPCNTYGTYRQCCVSA